MSDFCENCDPHYHTTAVGLIKTRYRENDSFRGRDLIGVTQCWMPSKFSDAELLHNIQVSI